MKKPLNEYINDMFKDKYLYAGNLIGKVVSAKLKDDGNFYYELEDGRILPITFPELIEIEVRDK